MNQIVEKFCPRCKQTKPIIDFAVDAKKRDGRFYICKICKRADDKRRRDDPVLGAQIRANNRRWHRENPDGSRAISRRVILRRHGLTVADFDALVEEQGGVCAICGTPPMASDPGGVLTVDHDHSTGQVRALLCHRCNRGLGQFGDDPELLDAASAYLRAAKLARVAA